MNHQSANYNKFINSLLEQVAPEEISSKPIARKSWLNYLPVSTGIVICLIFILTMFYNHLIFQILAEISAFILASSSFLIVLNFRKFVDNNYLLLITTAYFFVVSIDLLQVLTYEGINIFTPSGSDVAIKLWIMARYLQAISLAIAPYFITKKINFKAILCGYLAVTGWAIGSIFIWDIFPECYLEELGLTAFAQISQYLIWSLMIAAIPLTLQKRRHFDRYIFQLLSISFFSFLVWQIIFISHLFSSDIIITIAIFLKIFAIYLIYQVTIKVSLVKPYNFLIAKLQEKEKDLELAAKQLKTETLKWDAELFRANGELRLSTERLMLAIDSSKLIILDWDIAKNQIIWGQKYEGLLWAKSGKYNFNETAFEDWIYPEDRALTKQVIKSAKLEQQDYEHQFRVIWSDGNIHWLQAKGKFHKDLETKEMRMLISFLDITEQKQAEFALKKLKVDLETQVAYRTRELVQSNDDLQRQLDERRRMDKALKDQAELLNLAHDAIVTRDLNGMITFWNYGAQEMYGFTKQEALGKKIHVLLKTQFTKSMAQIEAEIFKTGRWEGELIQTKRNGDQIIVASRWAVKQDLQDRPLEILEIDSDITLAKQTEESLLATSVRLAGILDIAEDAIVSINEHQKITLFNQGAEKIFGYTAMEVLGKPLNILLPASSVNNEENHTSIVPNSTFDTIGKQRLVFGLRKDGKKFPAEASMSQLELVTGKIYTLILRDITERKEAEESLSEREERFRKVFEEGPLGMAIVSLDYRIISVNPMMCQMLGYLEAQITGINFIDFTHPDDLEREMPLIKQLANGKISYYKLDKRYLKKNKDIIWARLTVSIVRDTAKKALYFLAMLEDITEQKQAEETLRHREAEFRASIENAPDAIVRYDRELRCQYINPEIERQLGIPPKAFIGKLISEVGFNPEFVKIWQQALQKVFVTGRQESIEFDWIALTGQAYYQARIVPEFSSEGNVEFVLAIIRNITEIKQAQKQLENANEKLKKWVEELAFRNREIVLLGKMSDILQACITIEEAYQMLAELVKPLFPDVAGGIFVMNTSKDFVELVVHWCSNDDICVFNSKRIFAPNECWSLRRGRPHLVKYSEISLQCKHIEIPDLGKGDKKDELEAEITCVESQIQKHKSTNSKVITNSISKLSSIPAETLCVPMMAQGEALGVLYLSSPETGKLTPAKEQLAVTVAEHIGLALANLKLQEELKQQSIRDPLTGLYNRRYLEESLEREINRGIRLKQQLGVIMIDVDHFKRYNDNYGHEAGDVVLREIGKFLQERARGSDIACRYGGEELTLILPEATLESTLKRAEFLREGIKRLNLQYHRQPLGGITISLGVAVFPENGLTGAAVIAAADVALYEAKNQGRDRVVVAN